MHIHKLSYGTLKFVFDRTQIKIYTSYINKKVWGNTAAECSIFQEIEQIYSTFKHSIYQYISAYMNHTYIYMGRPEVETCLVNLY